MKKVLVILIAVYLFTGFAVAGYMQIDAENSENAVTAILDEVMPADSISGFSVQLLDQIPVQGDQAVESDLNAESISTVSWSPKAISASEDIAVAGSGKSVSLTGYPVVASSATEPVLGGTNELSTNDFVVTVPEPVTIALLGLGGFFIRKKR
ncbi:MAG: PEP-CTERM sorting domain-containing protein [Sedimentisphaeraceae bacterium JB056]